MDPLQPLYELVDSQLRAPALGMTAAGAPGAPRLQDPGMPQETPPKPEHPVVSQKKAVDDARKRGASITDAHQEVHGEVDLGDVESKKKLAQSLGRFSDEKTVGGVKPEKDSVSIYAQEHQKDKEDPVTDEDLKTPVDKEQPLDVEEEFDYHEFDVSYLQKYGRA